MTRPDQARIARLQRDAEAVDITVATVGPTRTRPVRGRAGRNA